MREERLHWPWPVLTASELTDARVWTRDASPVTRTTSQRRISQYPPCLSVHLLRLSLGLQVLHQL
jgi:hypothetical protein